MGSVVLALASAGAFFYSPILSLPVRAKVSEENLVLKPSLGSSAATSRAAVAVARLPWDPNTEFNFKIVRDNDSILSTWCTLTSTYCKMKIGGRFGTSGQTGYLNFIDNHPDVFLKCAQNDGAEGELLEEADLPSYFAGVLSTPSVAEIVIKTRRMDDLPVPLQATYPEGTTNNRNTYCLVKQYRQGSLDLADAISVLKQGGKNMSPSQERHYNALKAMFGGQSIMSGKRSVKANASIREQLQCTFWKLFYLMEKKGHQSTITDLKPANFMAVPDADGLKVEIVDAGILRATSVFQANVMQLSQFETWQDDLNANENYWAPIRTNILALPDSGAALPDSGASAIGTTSLSGSTIMYTPPGQTRSSSTGCSLG